MTKKRIALRCCLFVMSLVWGFFMYTADAEERHPIDGPLTEDSIDSCSISSDFKTLSCIDMGITEIEPGAFARFPDLTVLYLNENDIEYLEEGTFEGLNSLQHLNLEHNQISELNSGSFYGVQDTLKNIYLYDNNIRFIDPDTFSGMNSLEELVLQGNRMMYFYKDTFKGLNNLKKLSIYGNHVVCYPIGIFDGMDDVEIKRDDIGYCLTYENILDVCSWDGETQTLDCSSNNIESIPEFAFVMMDTVDSADPSVYHPANIKNLNLAGNKIEYISLETLYGLDDLEYIDLRGNPLYCYHDFTVWDDESGEEISIMDVDEGISVCLELDSNNVLDICDYSDYSILDCSNRGITSIAIGAFNNLGGHHYINGVGHDLGSILLNDNQISYIRPYTFEWLQLEGSNGSIIDFSNNKITRLDEGTFGGLIMGSHCRAGSNYIYLNNNKISVIEPGAFDGLSMILGGYSNHIYLDNNYLSYIKEGTFMGLSTSLQDTNYCYR